MPPPLAAVICIVFVFYLFRVERKKSEDVSAALLIPLVWMFLAGSRYAAQWLNLGAPVEASIAMYEEGSPLDRAVFLALIVAGVVVLLKRQLAWSSILIRNRWISLYFLFAVLSLLWSDYPIVSFKRWVKALGNVVMVLVILTEKDPYLAVGVVLRRLAFLTLPLSIVFIKYYPDLGRAYQQGYPMFTGVATQKNSLGQLCLLGGVYFAWSFLYCPKQRMWIKMPFRIPIEFIFFWIIGWLLYMADSATSLFCLIGASILFALGRLPSITRRPQRIVVLGLVLLLVFGCLEFTFDLAAGIIGLLGRDTTFTSRVPMWQELLAMVERPLLGAGYEIFWTGDRLAVIWENWGSIIQAHNGYLETYLNLGVVGLVILVVSIGAGLVQVTRYLSVDYPGAILRLSFILVVAFTNWTEATLRSVSNGWVLLLLGIMEVSARPETARSTVFRAQNSLRWAPDYHDKVNGLGSNL